MRWSYPALYLSAFYAVSVPGAFAAQVWVVNVLEESPAKFSRCKAVSEDGQYVTGISRKSGVDWPFYWSQTLGTQDMSNPSGGNVEMGACAVHADGSLRACANVGGLGRMWRAGNWTVLPPQPGSGARSVYGISYDSTTGGFWVVGSGYPVENEKAYRYNSATNAYLDYWGYYQDAYSVARNSWAVGKNNFGNGYGADGSQAAYDWRFEHPIFIFNWTENCAGGGNCGWDQLNRFSGYGDQQYYRGRATALGVNAHWAAGYLTYDPNNLSAYHAFKWQVPANPQPIPEPWKTWPRPIDLGVLGAGDSLSFAYCVSDSTSNPRIGGTSYGTWKYTGYKAVYWDNLGCHDLYTDLQALGVDMSRWSRLEKVNGVSANGSVMVGSGYYDDDNNPATAPVEMGFFIDFSNGPVPPPIITQQPVAQVGCAAGVVSFTVAATGAGSLSYQWQNDDVPLGNGGHYAGVFTTSLTISGLDAGDIASYRCVVTNVGGSTNSNEAALSVVSAAPPASTDGTPSVDGTDKITWKWTDVTDENGYHVKTAGNTVVSGDVPANTTLWQETALLANTSYTRTVYAFNACGESGGTPGQTRYTLSKPPVYGADTGAPSVTCDKATTASGLPLNGNVTFTSTNGFGDGPGKVGQFGYLWDNSSSTPANWTGESFWTTGVLVKQVAASAGLSRYLHIRAYNNGSPNAVHPTVLNLGPYTAGGVGYTCIQNPGFENGFTGSIASGWTAYTYPGACTPSFADGNTTFNSGAHSQQVGVGTGCEGGVYQRFDVSQGQDYTISVYFKCSVTNRISVFIGIDPFGGTNPGSSNVTWDGGLISTNFVKTSITKTAQTGTITLFLDVYGESGSGTAWIDDVGPPCSSLPPQVLDGTPLALSTTSIRWNWTDVSGETGYRVKNTTGTVLSPDLAANSTHWDEISGITPNSVYTRRIYALNSSGEGPGSTGQTAYSLIQTPGGVGFGSITATSIAASPSGTLTNLNANNSGVRTSNTTANTNSGWQAGQGAWISAGLSPNTLYAFVARARNGDGIETGDSPVATAYTLSSPPVATTVIPSDTAPCMNGSVIWSATDGFGAGKVEYYRYAWDQDPAHIWTDTETQWNSGTIATPTNSGGTWYLHLKGYNAANAGNGTFDYAVNTVSSTVAPDLNGDCRVDSGDLAIFAACATGSSVPYTVLPAGCTLSPDIHNWISADFDEDGDVDIDDFAVLQRCYRGSSTAPDPGCAP